MGRVRIVRQPHTLRRRPVVLVRVVRWPIGICPWTGTTLVSIERSNLKVCVDS